MANEPRSRQTHANANIADESLATHHTSNALSSNTLKLLVSNMRILEICDTLLYLLPPFTAVTGITLACIHTNIYAYIM